MASRPNGFIDDHQFRRVLKIAIVALHVVDARDDLAVVLEDAQVSAREVAGQAGQAGGLDDDRVQVELVAQFGFPLFAEMRRTEDAEAAHDAAIEQFADYERRLDCFARADVVSDEQPHGIEPEGHDQRDQLIWPRHDRELPERPEGSGTRAEG